MVKKPSISTIDIIVPGVLLSCCPLPCKYIRISRSEDYCINISAHKCLFQPINTQVGLFFYYLCNLQNKSNFEEPFCHAKKELFPDCIVIKKS